MNDLEITKELEAVDKSKAAQIEAVFHPMVEMLKGFEAAYEEVMAEDQSPDKSAKAKRLRLDIAKVRIEADKVRKAQKEEYLRAGNAIQGVYNVLKFAVVDKEEKLKEVETYYERIEQEKKEKIAAQRAAELQKYEAESTGLTLGDMPEDVWNNYLAGVKSNYEAIKEAERKAEEDRRAAEEKRELENKRRIQCSRLADFIPDFDTVVFSDFSEKEYKAIVDEAVVKRAEHEKQQEEVRKENERLKKAEEKAARERSEHEEELRKEREERARIEREQREKEEKAKREAEEKAAMEAEEAKKAELAPDKEKLIAHMKNLVTGKDSVKSTEAKKALAQAAEILSSAANRM